MCLTQETSIVLHLTLYGIASLIKLLLKKGLNYVLPGNIKNDRLEGQYNK